MTTIRPVDKVVLGAMLPLWVLCFSLSARSALRDDALPAFSVAGSPSAAAYPRIITVVPGAGGGDSELVAGDLLLRVGNTDLRGAGAIDVRAYVAEAGRAGARLTAIVERDGERLDTRVPAISYRMLVPLLAVSVSCLVTGLLLAARAPRPAPAVWPWVHMLLVGALAFGGRFSGDVWAVRMSMTIDGLSNALVCPLFLRALLLFPHGVPPEGRWMRCGLWGTAAYGVLYTSALYGVPSGLPHAFPALFAANALLYAVAPAALTRSYRHSDPIGRRQIRWVVFGAYCASAPVILGALLVLRDPGALPLWLASIAAMVLFPLSLIIAIARYNLFDIDRLISAATSYTIVLAVLVAAGVIVIPRAAEVTADVFNVDRTVAETILAVLLAGLIVPGRRGLGPVVDRGLFPERFALAHGVDQMVTELSECGDPEDLALKTGEELHRLIRPETCVLYTRRGDRYSPVFVRGVTVPPDFDGVGPLIRALQSEKRPVEVEEWLGRDHGRRLAAEETAAIASMRAAVLIPVLRRHAVAAVICLGRKRSGDVYTTTDLALLGVVASKVATELLRFDDTTLASIGERMAGMMHDLRNPLSIALGFTEMLASAETPEQRAELTHTIQRQFTLMERMARDVLAFARGESPLLIGRVRMDAFLRDLRAQIEPELAKHGVRLVLAPEFDGVAWFDEAKLLRAIYNLVRNAVEAIPGGGTVCVATRRVGQRLVFELRDTGTGIPPEIADRLFSPFATAGKKGGTGLGLAIVKKIVDEHGGTIAVQSAPGAGTCFRLELPLERGDHGSAPA